MTSLRNVKDECEKCGKIFECDLCRVGHGIMCKRDRVSEMVRCQMQHEEKRKSRESK